MWTAAKKHLTAAEKSWLAAEQLEHGLSIGVTNSSDSKSPFFGAEFDPNGHKNCEKNI